MEISIPSGLFTIKAVKVTSIQVFQYISEDIQWFSALSASGFLHLLAERTLSWERDSHLLEEVRTDAEFSPTWFSLTENVLLFNQFFDAILTRKGCRSSLELVFVKLLPDLLYLVTEFTDNHELCWHLLRELFWEALLSSFPLWPTQVKFAADELIANRMLHLKETQEPFFLKVRAFLEYFSVLAVNGRVW